MKIVYADKKDREFLNSLQKDKPHLYKEYNAVRTRARDFDYDEFQSWVKEETAKSQRTKRIKELKSGIYEFRLPPKDKHEVLRVEFTIEADYYSILIVNAYVKGHKTITR